MKRIILILTAIMCFAGCNGNRTQAQGRSPRSRQSINDPFYAITYPRTTGGPVQGRISGPAQPLASPEPSIGNIMAQSLPPVVQPAQPARPSPARAQAQPTQQAQGTPVKAPSEYLQPIVPVSGDLVGPSQVTLIYPSPEYGVIKVDKIIPKEVDLNVQFKYAIVVSNLTNATLANLVISESIAPTFQFKGASPAPLQATNNLLVWKLEALGPKASERFEISGIPSRLDTLTHATNITYSMATS
ncbi:MAG: hypothetical protein QHH07_11520, partial [Sedimentisphaerales bacterium]|nr:hypothetical protein [Sedimentisphaerales bacterium]